MGAIKGYLCNRLPVLCNNRLPVVKDGLDALVFRYKLGVLPMFSSKMMIVMKMKIVTKTSARNVILLIG